MADSSQQPLQITSGSQTPLQITNGPTPPPSDPNTGGALVMLTSPRKSNSSGSGVGKDDRKGVLSTEIGGTEKRAEEASQKRSKSREAALFQKRAEAAAKQPSSSSAPPPHPISTENMNAETVSSMKASGATKEQIQQLLTPKSVENLVETTSTDTLKKPLDAKELYSAARLFLNGSESAFIRACIAWVRRSYSGKVPSDPQEEKKFFAEKINTLFTDNQARFLKELNPELAQKINLAFTSPSFGDLVVQTEKTAPTEKEKQDMRDAGIDVMEGLEGPAISTAVSLPGQAQSEGENQIADLRVQLSHQQKLYEEDVAAKQREIELMKDQRNELYKDLELNVRNAQDYKRVIDHKNVLFNELKAELDSKIKNFGDVEQAYKTMQQQLKDTTSITEKLQADIYAQRQAYGALETRFNERSEELEKARARIEELERAPPPQQAPTQAPQIQPPPSPVNAPRPVVPQAPFRIGGGGGGGGGGPPLKRRKRFALMQEYIKNL